MLANISKYYKFVAAAVGALVVLLNEVTPVLDFIPDGTAKHIFNVVVTIVTAVSVFLVRNEPLVEPTN